MTKRAKKLAPTPIIRAKQISAKDLLLKIRAIVLEEPKRLDMRWWISRWRGKKKKDAIVSDVPEPACGTVGCIAGWGAVLLRGSDVPRGGYSLEALMNRLVGVDDDTFTDYWYGTPVDKLFDSRTNSAPGTRDHAREIARRIDGYISDYPELAERIIDVKTRKVVAS